ncbi:MAG: hypothetical protein ACKVWR_23090 [Acidimicrobiales bacterium]
MRSGVSEAAFGRRRRAGRAESGRRSLVWLGWAALVAATGCLGREDAAEAVLANTALVDLQTARADPTDGASASLRAVTTADSTKFSLEVRGLGGQGGGGREGQTLSAHLHVGPCVRGNGEAAGGHFNHTGGAEVSARSEVWLDFEIQDDGSARVVQTAPFVIPSGAARSLVVHEHETRPDGSAGARLACLPVGF